MRRVSVVVSSVVLASSALVRAPEVSAAHIVVNCDHGQSLNRAIALLPQATVNTVTVEGTCTEYVQIRGVNDLTVGSTAGARIVQPPVDPSRPCLALGTLTIDSSRSVSIEGLVVQASSTDACSIAVFVRNGSSDVRLRGVTTTGGNQSFCISERSQVSLAGVVAREPGWAGVGVFDDSAAYVEDSAFENSQTQGWHEGIVAARATAAVHGTRITNMQVGLDANNGGVITLANFADYLPVTSPSDVTIDCPAGTNFNGVVVAGGASLSVAPSFTSGSVKLRVTNAGQTWGGESGAVLVTDASSFDAGGNLEIVGPQGQGVVVANDSYANLAGISVSGSAHGGLVVVNNSTANLDQWYAPSTLVTGSAGPDLFCDSTSLITGGNKAPTSTRQCANVLGGATVPLP